MATPMSGSSNTPDNHQRPTTDAEASPDPDQTQSRQPVRASLRIREATEANDQAVEPAPANNSASENTPLFGSVRARNAMFYFKATVTQLKRIIASTPRNLRAQLPSPVNKEALVNEVIRLRENEATTSQEPHLTPEACLTDLLSMTEDAITQLLQDNPATLRTIMTSALQADSSLTPRDLPSEDRALEVIALKWQLQAHRAASSNDTVTPQQQQPSIRRVTFQDQAPPSRQVTRADTALRPSQNNQDTIVAQPTLIAEPAPPRTGLPTIADFYAEQPQPSNSGNRSRSLPYASMDSSDEEDFIRPRRKKNKSSLKPTFKWGASSALDETLSVYPGKTPGANSWNVDDLLGPHILAKMISKGQDVPTFLNRFAHWKKTPNGIPTHAEMEAYCLGRTIHLQLVRHESPKKPWRSAQS